MTILTVLHADITTLDVDAIVNAANAELAGGGGVDGAIHRAAGHARLQAALRVYGGCPVGEVVLTPGFDLKARHIIHAVGPVWRGGDSQEAEHLASCYRRSLEMALGRGLASVAFPAISTGVYGYPPELAAPLAVGTVRGFTRANPGLREVIFCCFSAESAELHRTALGS